MLKVTKVVLLSLVAVALIQTAAFGAVASTPHNLSATNAKGEICLPCHTPHNAAKPIGYLWNHTHKADSAFTKWEDAELSGGSLSCLSCHDGQTSVDDYYGSTAGSAGAIVGRAALGVDLTNDHPVGVPYPSSSRYATLGTVHGRPGVVIGTSGLPLHEHNGVYQIECSTCHTPHSNTKGNFLRADNAGSALCLACHTSW